MLIFLILYILWSVKNYKKPSKTKLLLSMIHKYYANNNSKKPNYNYLAKASFTTPLLPCQPSLMWRTRHGGCGPWKPLRPTQGWLLQPPASPWATSAGFLAETLKSTRTNGSIVIKTLAKDVQGQHLGNCFYRNSQ